MTVEEKAGAPSPPTLDQATAIERKRQEKRAEFELTADRLVGLAKEVWGGMAFDEIREAIAERKR